MFIDALQGLMLVMLTNKAGGYRNTQIFEICGDEAVIVKSVTSAQELEAFLSGYQRIVKCQLLYLDDEISGIYQKQG